MEQYLQAGHLMWALEKQLSSIPIIPNPALAPCPLFLGYFVIYWV